jgi:hypothetical protein
MLYMRIMNMLCAKENASPLNSSQFYYINAKDIILNYSTSNSSKPCVSLLIFNLSLFIYITVWLFWTKKVHKWVYETKKNLCIWSIIGHWSENSKWSIRCWCTPYFRFTFHFQSKAINLILIPFISAIYEPKFSSFSQNHDIFWRLHNKNWYVITLTQNS